LPDSKDSSLVAPQTRSGKHNSCFIVWVGGYYSSDEQHDR